MLATGPIIAVGALDMLMPVSALAVLLGSLSGISITRLLMGGFVPGMLLKAAFVAYIIVSVKLNPSLAPAGQLAVYQRLGKDQADRKICCSHSLDLFGRRYINECGMGDPNRVGSGRRVCHDGAGACLPCVDARNLVCGAAGHDNDLGNDPVHYRRSDNLLADPVIFRSKQRDSVADHGTRSDAKRNYRWNDADTGLSWRFRRSGEHDVDYASDLYACRATTGHRPRLVRRNVPNLYAAWPAASATRLATDDYEGSRAAASQDESHIPRGGAVYRAEHSNVGARVFPAGGGALVTELGSLGHAGDGSATWRSLGMHDEGS